MTPLVIVYGPLNDVTVLFVPDTIKKLVALFSITPATLLPRFALIVLDAPPPPEFVMVPVLLILVVCSRICPTLVALSTRLPVPTTPAVTTMLVPELFVLVNVKVGIFETALLLLSVIKPLKVWVP